MFYNILLTRYFNVVKHFYEIFCNMLETVFVFSVNRTEHRFHTFMLVELTVIRLCLLKFVP